MKRVISSIVLLCFMICSLGIIVAAEDLVAYNNYTVEGTFSGAEAGSIISIFVLKDGYTMNDLASSSGSVLDKVYYTNMFATGAGGSFSFSIPVPSEALSAQCVISCNGQTQTGKLREFVTGSAELKIIYASAEATGGSGTNNDPYKLSSAISKALEYTAAGYDVEIAMKGGKYSYEDSRIQMVDKNATDKRITFRPASEDDKVVITSMKEVGSSSITKVTDNAILSKIPENSRGMIYKLDMEKAGFAVNQTTRAGGNYNVLSMNYQPINSDDGMAGSRSITPPILYLNGKRQMLSQYPNEGTVAFDFRNSVSTSNGYPTLSYKDSSVSSKMDFGKWSAESLENAFITGLLHNTYRGAAAKITNVDTTNKKITIDGTLPLLYKSDGAYTWNKTYYGPRVAMVNLIEEMDVPGEYYVDSENYCIYYYAPYELTEDDVFEMANDKCDKNGDLMSQLLFIQRTNNITFDSIEFYGSRTTYPIYISLCDGVEFRNCTIHATAATGMSATGKNLVVEGCNIYDTGKAGIYLSGIADFINDSTPSNNMIENNHVYNYGLNPTYGSNYMQGITIGNRGSVTYGGSTYRASSLGDTVQNNLIHANKFYGAIQYKGYRINVTRNEVYNVLDSVDDSGVIYSGRSIREFGNYITENFIHDFGIYENPRYVNMAIYWDDYMSGQTAQRNIIVGNQPSNQSLLGVRTIGVDNLMKNNIVVDTNIAFRLSGRSPATFRSDNSTWGLVGELDYLPTSDYERYKEMVDLRTTLKSYSSTTLKLTYNGVAKENLTVNCAQPTNNDGYTSYYKDGTNMIDNKTADRSIFVNEADKDYRVKASAITAGTLTNVPNENNFDMDWIGVQKEMPEADQSFKLMYPARSEIVSKSNVVLTWEQALFADEYEWVISTDKNFGTTFASGTTKNNLVVPNKTFTDGTTYYWKVTAKNISRNMGKIWNADQIGTFTVGEGMSLQIVDNTVLSADGTTKLTTLKDQTAFNVDYAVYNKTASTQNYVVFAALYAPNGTFKQARVASEKEDGSALAVATKQVATGTIKFFTTALEDGCYVKTFVFDNLNRIVPLSFFHQVLKK